MPLKPTFRKHTHLTCRPCLIPPLSIYTVPKSKVFEPNLIIVRQLLSKYHLATNSVLRTPVFLSGFNQMVWCHFPGVPVGKRKVPSVQSSALGPGPPPLPSGGLIL